MVTRQSELIFIVMLHFVYFDGTSAFVGSDIDATDDTEVLFSSYDLEECFDFCEEENERIGI